MNECGFGCKVALNFDSGCGACATDQVKGSAVWAGGTASSGDDDQERALTECGVHTQVLLWIELLKLGGYLEMIKHCLQTFMAVSLFTATLINVAEASEKRCGWLENPTPGNWWLTDADDTWIIAAQGGYSVDDDAWDKIGDISEKEYVATNGSYGYACACLSVTVDKQDKRILKVHSFKQLPLKKCKDDRSLPKQE